MRSSSSSCWLRRLTVRGSTAVLVATGLVLGTAGAASAAPTPSTPEFLCTAGGQIDVHSTAEGTYDWTVSGIGSCSNTHLPQVRQVTLVGSATTEGLGVCSNEPVIPAFSMSVTATFLQLIPTPATTIEHEVWQLPATTYPVVTPFGVTDEAGNPMGAGEFSTHVFVRCPPGGQPTMQVSWSQSA